MSEMINGRMPEHIKAGLRCRVIGDAKCSDCAYYGTVLYEIGQREYECDDIDRDALALIEHLESERDAVLAKVPKWISVEEQMPPIDTEVLVFATEKIEGFGEVYALCRYEKARNMFGQETGRLEWDSPWDYFHTDYKITHWMPLPEPPKEEAHEDNTDPQTDER